MPSIKELRLQYPDLDKYGYSDEEALASLAEQTGTSLQEVKAYYSTEVQEKYDPYAAYEKAVESGGSGGGNTPEGIMGTGQFFIEMIIGMVALVIIIKISKVHKLIWIPAVGFLAGYAISAQDASYAFSNVFGGLTFSLLCSFIAGVWIQRKKKKANSNE